MKPQLADNWLEDKQRLPAWQQPKFDGVRGMHIVGSFTGRSLKAFKNKDLTKFWSDPEFAWLDGELILPNSVGTEARMCSLTTGLCNRVNATEIPDLVAFDYLHPDLIAKGTSYRDRFGELVLRVEHLQNDFGMSRVRLVPNFPVETMDKVLELDSMWLDGGYEGSILRNPDAVYKEGRPSTKVQELMRIKRFIDFEFTITSLYEAMENQNEAKTNPLGRTERSSHKENKVAKGMLGGFIGVVLNDVIHDGAVLFPKGMTIKVGAGQSDHIERTRWWNNPGEVVGQVAKAKTFPQGVKDKMRMPIFLALRSAEDMS